MGFAARFLTSPIKQRLEEFGDDRPTSGLASMLSDLLPASKMSLDLEEFDKQKLRRDKSMDRIQGHVEKDVYYWEPKSLRIRAINFSHLFMAEYMGYLCNAAIVGVLAAIAAQAWYGYFELARLRVVVTDPAVLQITGFAAIVIAYVSSWKPAIYCVENVVYVPPEEWKVTRDDIINCMKAQPVFNPESLAFQMRILENSGTGEATYWPPAIVTSKDGVSRGDCNMEAARLEAKEVIFSLVRDLLRRTGVKPRAIDFLVINCSLFCPTPSLCALVCNEFCLRQDVRTYNLGGMGCSANGISVDLARQLLENRPGSQALVISTENITQNLYSGNDKAMLLQNTLFRCGGCALLMSSRRRDALRAKYKLLHTFRAQLSDDDSYHCVYQKQDEHGNSGIALSKDIVTVAGRAMRQNFVQLGPYVLPLREQVAVLYNHLAAWLVKKARKSEWPLLKELSVPQGYTPDFGRGIDHFCIHAGGRAVIEGVKKNLRLSDRQVAPSVQTLYEWGNTSSSSVWYEMDWIERWGDLRRGERVLQIAFGSGFKCNSAVWVALRVDPTKVRRDLKASAAQAERPAGGGDDVDCSEASASASGVAARSTPSSLAKKKKR